MDDKLFHKIIDDLTYIPQTHKFLVTLARINEPLLDKRLEVFSKHITKALPNASHIFWSNGSTLVTGKFEWMGEIEGSTLVISLNSIDEKNHTAMMGFGLEKVLKNLDYLHLLKEKNLFGANVILNAPYQSAALSVEFIKFCKNRWPLFNPNVLPFFKWQGQVSAGEKERQLSKFFIDTAAEIATLGCGQWFDIHVLANGQITKCCIDEAGYQAEKFSARTHSILNLYRKSQHLRDRIPSRGGVSSCQTCTHLG